MRTFYFTAHFESNFSAPKSFILFIVIHKSNTLSSFQRIEKPLKKIFACEKFRNVASANIVTYHSLEW